jgi:hypothetical protein
MPAIRDLISAISRRPGVDAAIVVGRDGLVIDADATEGVDPDRVAAHLPALLAAAEDVGAAAGRGGLATAVLEHERGGLAVLSVLTRDVMLLVLLDPAADTGALLYELRTERGRLASQV